MCVAIVLYKLASCTAYRIVANQFGVKKVFFFFFFLNCDAILQGHAFNSTHRNTYTSEAGRAAQRFEGKFHLQQIIGCINRTHTPLPAPSDSHNDFVNKKGWQSYVLKAVVQWMNILVVLCLMAGGDPLHERSSQGHLEYLAD